MGEKMFRNISKHVVFFSLYTRKLHASYISLNNWLADDETKIYEYYHKFCRFPVQIIMIDRGEELKLKKSLSKSFRSRSNEFYFLHTS